jgi:hypothetical protein
MHHYFIAISQGTVALQLVGRGRLEAAHDMFKRSIALHIETLGLQHWRLGVGWANLAQVKTTSALVARLCGQTSDGNKNRLDVSLFGYYVFSQNLSKWLLHPHLPIHLYYFVDLSYAV